MRHMTVGVIDVGTNATHLLIGRLGSNGCVRVVRQEHDRTRLGEGGLAGGTLTPASMHRTLTVLRRYASTLTRQRIDRLEAVATSAVREAGNGRAFVRRIRAQLGIPLRIISGEQEARLIYRGVLSVNRITPPCAVVAIGGGSAQVTYGDRYAIRYATSVPLGCARLAQQFLHHDPPQAGELDRLDRAVRRAWTPITRRLRRYRWRQAFGSSAAIAYLARLCARLASGSTSARTAQLLISQGVLRRTVGWLAASTAAQRRRRGVCDAHQARQALAAAIVLRAWMERCGISRVRCVPGSLREGLVVALAPGGQGRLARDSVR